MNQKRSSKSDPLAMWLGELESLTMGLDNFKGVPPSQKSKQLERYSLINLEESADVDLDLLLGQLNAFGSQFEKEVAKLPPHQPRFNHHRSSSAGNGLKPKLELGPDYIAHPSSHNSDYHSRTESPDNDSAFSDNVSMLSSGSSASSGGAPRTESSSQNGLSQSNLRHSVQITTPESDDTCSILEESSNKVPPIPDDQAARIKAEKIRIALEKMRQANVKKLFIKAYTEDNSSKSLMVDESMTVAHVCRLLSEKNHTTMDTRWALIEHLPDLYMERIYEDHEKLVDSLLLWTRDSRNQLLFLSRKDKYDFFVTPEQYLLDRHSSERGNELDEESRNTLLEEFFGSTGLGVPEVEGHLYLKNEAKKTWKKHYFVLRASGLYYCPKGKSKLSRDLSCLANFEMTNIYLGYGWRKKYKAPTDFGFAIKHPQIQTKSSKHIKYFCADDEKTLRKWVMGIRIAKYGRQLKLNFDKLQREMAEEDLDTLAQSRSFSVCSVAKNPPTPVSEFPSQSYNSHNYGNLRRQESVRSNASSSSGCPSERSTPTAEHMAFETDCPGGGTIKRKPCLNAKIPLTSTTRNLAKTVVIEEAPGDTLESTSSTSTSSSSNSGTLNRRASIRTSFRQNEDRVMFNSLSRKLHRTSDIMIIPPQVTQTMERTHAIESMTTTERKKIQFAQQQVIHHNLPPPPGEDLYLASSLENLNEPLPPPEGFKGSTFSLDSTDSFPPPPPPPEDYPKEEEDWRNGDSFLPPPPESPSSSISSSTSSESSSEYSSSGLPNANGLTFVKQPRNRLNLNPLPSSKAEHPDNKKKPPPPPRSENTKLTTSEHLPEVFITDLQRVMEKKWKVAQQLNKDDTSSAHEILGFRDSGYLPPPSQSSPPQAKKAKKKQPPPPPKRSETTQLSQWQ